MSNQGRAASSTLVAIPSDLGHRAPPSLGLEGEVVSSTHGEVQVVDNGEGQGVLVGRLCTLDHSPVPGTSDGEGPPSAMDIRTRTEGAL
jgi:hypothetical protein